MSRPDQIEGVICCDSHTAGGSGGSASQWAPRPYFAPPYQAPVGAAVEVIFEEVAPGQLIHEWQVVA